MKLIITLITILSVSVVANDSNSDKYYEFMMDQNAKDSISLDVQKSQAYSQRRIADATETIAKCQTAILAITVLGVLATIIISNRK